MQIDVTYYHHSGFSVAMNGALLVFDYWLGQTEQDVPAAVRLTPELLAQYEEVYVFISHSHPDHFEPQVLEWGGLMPVTYIIGDDLPGHVRGNRMSAGDILQVNSRMTVTACASTDLGVSFHVLFDGLNIFHAGDLNFWHWREESTVQEIEEADAEFRTACETVEGLPIDIAFFPVDPRQGMLFDAGANYFQMRLKPRMLIPMHYWGMSEVIAEFARRSRSDNTEIIPLLFPGAQLLIDMEDDGYMTVETTLPPELPREEILRREHSGEIPGFDDEDPFFHSDEPVDLS